MRGFKTKRLKIPEWAHTFTQELGFIDHGKKRFCYAVLRKDFHPNLTGFVVFVQGSTFLYISEEVPPEYRELLLMHELREFRTYRRDKDGCRRALEKELKDAEAQLGAGFKMYLEWRLRNLKAQLQFQLEDTNGADYGEGYPCRIKKSVILLEGVVENM